MTNIKKRSLAIIMAILVGMMFTVPSLPVTALSKTGKGKFVTAGKGQSGGYYTSRRIWKNTGKLTYYDVAGKTCLCLNKTKPFGSGGSYKGHKVSSISYIGYQRNWLKPVLRFAYGSSTEPPYGNKADKFAASQIIVWQLSAKEIGKSTSTLGAHKSGHYYSVLKGHTYGLKNYDWIIKRVNQWKKGPSFDGKKYQLTQAQSEGTYSFVDSNSYQKYKKDSTKNLDLKSVVKTTKGKYKYTVKLKNPEKSGTLTLVDSKTAKSGAWYIYKSSGNQTVSARPPSDTREYTVKFKPEGIPEDPSLKIQKINAETGEPVREAGFAFQIRKKSDGTLWKIDGESTFVTDVRGLAIIDPFVKCSAGEWQVIETAVPKTSEDGIQFELNSTPMDIPAIGSGDDVEMTVKFKNYPAPDIETSAYDKDTTTHLGTIGENCTIIDKVTCTSLVKNREYTINGVLVDKESGKDIEGTNQSVTFTMPSDSGPITDKDGNEIGEAIFEEDEASVANIYMTYTFDSSAYAGKETVVAETLIPKGGSPVVHRDLEDDDQTVLFPKIGTRAFDLVTESNVGSVSKNETIKDIISFNNLIAGKEYTAIGKIIDKETGDVLAEKEAKFNVNDDGSTDVDEEKASEINFNIVYKPNSAYEEVDGKLQPVEGAQGSGSDVTQEINAEKEKQKEEADEGTSSLYTFGDDDSEENLSGCHFGAPEGYVFDGWNTEPDGSGTSYSPGRSVSSLNAEEGDTVTLYAQYIKGEEDDEPIDPDAPEEDPDADNADEKDIPDPDITTQKFVNGEIEMTFDDFDSSKLQGKQIVVFEVVKYNDNEIAKHEEIDSEEQTITYPSVHTNALDKATNEHVPVLDKKQTIVDTVTYTGLTPDKEYTLKGKLMDKKTGKPFLENGKEVTNEIKFTPEEPDGEIQLEFEVDATALAGKTLVVFEDILLEDNPVVAHADIEDEDQSVHYPEIGTKAADVKTKDEVGTTIKKTTLSDTVSYKNLIAGKEYDVRGVLMDKETNKPIVGKDGEQITGHAKFTPEGEGAVSGTVNVVFEFDSDIVKGKSIVVFEDLYLGEHKVATHSDINDKDQTVHYNELKTTATVDSKHDVESNNYVVINDKVMYKNLVPGKKYTVKGVLMDKGTKKPVVQNGKKVTASRTFTAKKKNGFVVLNFRVNAGAIGNKTTVAFEDLYHNKVKIGTHSDINDNAQTVKFKKPPIPPVQSGDTGLPWWIFAIIAGLAVVAGGAVIYKKRR